MNKKLRFSLNLIVTLLLIVFLPAQYTKANDYIDITTSENIEYLIYIDVNERNLYVINKLNEEVLKTYPVAIGKKETPSPLGTWQITGKAFKDGPFGGYWLGLNVPWDTFGIHGTNRPDSIGSMASNGCIRLNNNHIYQLFNMIPVGTSVIITGGSNFRFSCYSRNIHPHDKGADVYHVQQILKDLGYFRDNITGIYDYSLEVAVLTYKEEHDFSDLTTEIDSIFLDSIGLYRFE